MVTNRQDKGLATAVQALLVLVEAPRGMATSAEVGEVVGSHPVVVRRLLGALRMSGLVEARVGREGGWAIGKDPSKIRISQILLALSEGGGTPPESALDELLASANAAYLARLSAVTLADLAEPQSPRPHS
jgi:DNA-binding IscR family transcriptional regulator